jgi:hypothetical protein
VADVEDYNIKGSFDPNSPSDIEYYGYRETTFTITNMFAPTIIDGCSLLLPMDKSEIDFYSKNYDRQLTLIVQQALDEKSTD